MSRWIGSVTPSTINLVRVGGGNGALALLAPLLLLAGGVALIVAFSVEVEVVLTVLASLVLVAGAGRIVWELVGDKHADRVEARWRRDVARAALTRGPVAALPPATPVRVDSYVVDRDREHEPIDLDAFGGRP